MVENIISLKKGKFKIIVFLSVAVNFLSGFMFGLKGSLSHEWVRRFSNVDELNVYAEQNKVWLKSVKLKDINLTNVRLSAAAFKNTDWENVEFIESNISSSVFDGGDYRDISFGKSIIKDTVFRNVTFRRADFESATLLNVKFINCNFGGANFKFLGNSSVVFEGAVLEEVEFYRSNIDATFAESKLTEVELMGAKGDHLLIRDSDVYDLDLENAIFLYVEFSDSTLKDVLYHGGQSNKMVLKNLKGAIKSAASKIEQVEAENIDADDLLLAGVRGKSVKLTNVNVSDSLNLRATVESLEIHDSKVGTIWNSGSNVKVFVVKNTTLGAMSTTHSNFGKLLFENVKITEGINFEQTHADEVILNNLSKGPKFEFFGEGSNIKL